MKIDRRSLLAAGFLVAPAAVLANESFGLTPVRIRDVTTPGTPDPRSTWCRGRVVWVLRDLTPGGQPAYPVCLPAAKQKMSYVKVCVGRPENLKESMVIRVDVFHGFEVRHSTRVFVPKAQMIVQYLENRTLVAGDVIGLAIVSSDGSKHPDGVAAVEVGWEAM